MSRVSVGIDYISISETLNAFGISVGKCERNRPLARPRRRWDYNDKMNLKKWDEKI
jgi:hypothetical protein